MPRGYHIWNIGKYMIDGYLPLCRLKVQQPYPGAREIEPETLKAIRIDRAQRILAAVSSGCNTLSKMKAYVEEHQNASPDTWEYTMVQPMREVIPYMKQIKWQ